MKRTRDNDAKNVSNNYKEEKENNFCFVQKIMPFKNIIQSHCYEDIITRGKHIKQILINLYLTGQRDFLIYKSLMFDHDFNLIEIANTDEDIKNIDKSLMHKINDVVAYYESMMYVINDIFEYNTNFKIKHMDVFLFLLKNDEVFKQNYINHIMNIYIYNHIMFVMFRTMIEHFELKSYSYNYEYKLIKKINFDCDCEPQSCEAMSIYNKKSKQLINKMLEYNV